MNTEISRRELLGTAAAGTAVAGGLCKATLAAQAGGSPFSFGKTRVLRVFIGRHPGWPRPDLDTKAEHERLMKALDEVPGQGDIEYVGNTFVNDPKALTELMEAHQDAAGILAVQVCMGTRDFLNIMADSGRPTVLFATPYSGHEWSIVPDLQRTGKKIDVIASSRFENVLEAVRVFRAIGRMKQTRVLFVGGHNWQPPADYVADIKKKFGTTVVTYDHTRLVEAYDAIPAAAVEADTEKWIKGAQRVREPNREEIAKSARFCLALQKVMAEEKAFAITINCLGLFSHGLPAYPCFGFARLNDLGLAGVCEADLPSTMTQIIFQHMEGVPGFVTDPVVDLSNNTVIHAHCVAATKMDGPAGESAPYEIRSHLEDHKGAVLQTKMRVGQEITMAKLVGAIPRDLQAPSLAASPAESWGANILLLSTGRIVAIPDSDRGCRTKAAVKVSDARKLLENWSNGLHRVIFYGSHMTDAKRFARFTGIEVFEEC